MREDFMNYAGTVKQFLIASTIFAVINIVYLMMITTAPQLTNKQMTYTQTIITK
jgi:hypothetical protein